MPSIRSMDTGREGALSTRELYQTVDAAGTLGEESAGFAEDTNFLIPDERVMAAPAPAHTTGTVATATSQETTQHAKSTSAPPQPLQQPPQEWSLTQRGEREAPLVYVNVGQGAPAAPMEKASSDKSPSPNALDKMLGKKKKGSEKKPSSPQTNLFVVEHESSQAAKSPPPEKTDPYAISVKTSPKKSSSSQKPSQSLWKRHFWWWIGLIIVGCLGVAALIIWAIAQHQASKRDKDEQERMQKELGKLKAAVC